MELLSIQKECISKKEKRETELIEAQSPETKEFAVRKKIAIH